MKNAYKSMYLVVFFIKLQNVMKQLKISQMAIVIVATTLFFSCSKTDLTDTKGSTGGSKNAAFFTSNPALSQDTLYARTPATINFDYKYAQTVISSLGSLSESKKMVNLPGQEVSTSCTITLTGEDGVNLEKTIQVPVYDTVLSYAVKATKGWKMISAIRYFPGGSVNLSLDTDTTIYFRDIYLGGRKGKNIHNGNLSDGVWYNIGNGSEFGDGLHVWKNEFISSTTWRRSRTDGTNIWVVTHTAIQ